MQIGNIFYSIGDMLNGVGKYAKKEYFNSRPEATVNKGTVYINAIVPYKIYNTIPQFKVPVDKLASMFSNGVFKYQKIGAEGYLPVPPEIAKLLENPNVMQGQNPFLKQYYRQLKVYGNQFIYKSVPSPLSKFPASLKNISPALLKPVLTGKYFDQTTLEGIISHYEYTENGTTRKFEVNTVIWSKIDDLDSPLIGVSPLLGLEFPTSNTELAYKYLNCISGERGALGILSTAPNRDSMGTLPATAAQKAEAEKQYRDSHGTDNDQIKTIITSAQMTYAPMSYPTRDLMLKEQIDDNGMVILDALGVNRNLFNNSTYENLKHGLVSTHNDTIVPDADGFTQSLGKEIGVQPGYRLVLDYSHLPYLQADKSSEADTFQKVSNSLSSLVSAGIIDVKQANAILLNQFGITV